MAGVVGELPVDATEGRAWRRARSDDAPAGGPGAANSPRTRQLSVDPRARKLRCYLHTRARLALRAARPWLRNPEKHYARDVTAYPEPARLQLTPERPQPRPLRPVKPSDTAPEKTPRDLRPSGSPQGPLPSGVTCPSVRVSEPGSAPGEAPESRLCINF